MLAQYIIYVMDLLTASWFHFMFSGFVGCLVFLWIQTIFFDVCMIFRGYVLPPKGLRIFMACLGLVLGLCAAWFCHVGLDAISTWWTSPLAPHLNIIK